MGCTMEGDPVNLHWATSIRKDPSMWIQGGQTYDWRELDTDALVTAVHGRGSQALNPPPSPLQSGSFRTLTCFRQHQLVVLCTGKLASNDT